MVVDKELIFPARRRYGAGKGRCFTPPYPIALGLFFDTDAANWQSGAAAMIKPALVLGFFSCLNLLPPFGEETAGIVSSLFPGWEKPRQATIGPHNRGLSFPGRPRPLHPDEERGQRAMVGKTGLALHYPPAFRTRVIITPKLCRSRIGLESLQVLFLSP